MKKYLPTNSEWRIAIFTSLLIILIFFVGGHLLKFIVWNLKNNHNNYFEENKMSNMMHKMPDGSMMMNHELDMMEMTMNDMVTMLEGKSGKALEKEFILGMIPHHAGAVEMSKKLLQDKNISPEIKKFAEDIITAQEKEIEMMKKWEANY